MVDIRVGWWVIGKEWWVLDVRGGCWSQMMGIRGLVLETSGGGYCSQVVGAGAVKHNNLCCHCQNMAGIGNVAGVDCLVPEASY